jgi:hypothetical protein
MAVEKTEFRIFRFCRPISGELRPAPGWAVRKRVVYLSCPVFRLARRRSPKPQALAQARRTQNRHRTELLTSRTCASPSLRQRAKRNIHQPGLRASPRFGSSETRRLLDLHHAHRGSSGRANFFCASLAAALGGGGGLAFRLHYRRKCSGWKHDSKSWRDCLPHGRMAETDSRGSVGAVDELSITIYSR